MQPATLFQLISLIPIDCAEAHSFRTLIAFVYSSYCLEGGPFNKHYFKEGPLYKYFLRLGQLDNHYFKGGPLPILFTMNVCFLF